MKDTIISAIAMSIIAGIFVLVISVPIAGDYFISKYRCSTTASVMGTTSDYGFFSGCMVKVNGKLFPLKLLRAQ